MIGRQIIEQWTNHLWQSTLFAVVATLVTLAFRKNRAQVRYCLWLSASIKFLVPFALLINLGNSLWSAFAARGIATEIAPPAVSLTVQQIAQPFTDSLSFVPSATLTHTAKWIPIAVLSVWICGFLGVVLVRFRGWLHIRAAMRASVPIDIQAAAAVRSSPELLEPGVVGILRPVLILPRDILKHLSPSQLDAVIAHELSHIRRRDNLTAVIHMLVEALFWFHPFVWWIGARLVEERERACDEAVLSLGSEPRDYADAIVSVCKLCVESPLACVSGISGADLKKRIVRIMARHVGLRMSLGRKLLLAAAGLLAVAAPVAEGLAYSFHLRAQLLFATGSAPSFEVATIKPSHSSSGLLYFRLMGTRFRAENASLTRLVWFAYDINSSSQLAKVPGWMNSASFDVDAKITDAQVEALKNLPPQQRFNQYRLMVQSLLADRFKMKVRTEVRELPVYALAVAKDGPKLTVASLPAGTQQQHLPSLNGEWVKGELNARAVSMKFFAENFLSRREELGGRLAVDATGLQGSYDFDLKWSPDDMGAEPPGAGAGPSSATADSSGPSLPTALQEQLGLKLKLSKAPVDVLVIDHIEQPSPN